MTIHWRELVPADLGSIAALAQRSAAVDGGMAATTSESYLERRYTGLETAGVGAFEADSLIACGAVRAAGDAVAAVGQVDPEHRGKGLGGELLDRLIAEARPRAGRLQVETESLTPEAHQLFISRGLRQTFAEDVLRRELREPFESEPLPDEVTVEEWSEGNRDDFFDAYQRSFADRPGFPGWSAQQWIDWTAADEEFLPSCSLLVRGPDGTPAGFVTCAEGFLIQVGVAPEWRQRKFGRALAVAALARMRESDPTGEVFLDININNQASAALFAGIGFTAITRRAQYEEAA